MESLKKLWQRCQHHAHEHHKTYHRTHNATHLCYLGLVTFHGPYTIAAGILFVILVAGWILHLED